MNPGRMLFIRTLELAYLSVNSFVKLASAARNTPEVGIGVGVEGILPPVPRH